MISRITSFAYTPRPSRPVTRMRRTFSGSIARHCDASTSRTCDVPMPNATAPNAPCVEVWLSPQAIVIPGCVSPSSGPMTWTMPCEPLARSKSRMPASRQFRSSADNMSSAITSRTAAADRASARCDRRSRTCALETAHASRARAACRTPAGWSPRGQMEPDEELGLPVGQPAHRVRVPDLLEQRRGHCLTDVTTLRRPALGAQSGTTAPALGAAPAARASANRE